MRRMPQPPKPTGPGILQMAAPLVVSFWMRSLFTFVDTIYASTLGDPSVAAIGLSIPFEFLMIAVWVGLSTGLTSNLASAMGARQERRIEQHLRVGWKLVFTAVPVFGAVGAACWPLASRISPDAAVAREFAVYGTVLLGGSALTLFWSVIPDSIVKAHGDTRATMWAGIWSNLLNLVLNTVFLFIFEWGIFGIALSTVLGRFGGLGYALWKAAEHERKRKAAGLDTEPGTDPAPYAAQLSLAVPAALAFCLMATETAIVNGLLSRLDRGTAAVAAYAIFYRVFQFAVMPAIAAAVAMLPFAARRFGAGDVAGVRSGLRTVHVAGIAYVVLSAPVLWFTAGPLSRALAESPATAEFATYAIRLVPLGCLASLPFFLIRPVFEAMGRGRPGLAMAAVRYLLLTAPLAWAGIRIAPGLGWPPFHGLVLGLIASGGVASSIFALWVRAVLRAR